MHTLREIFMYRFTVITCVCARAHIITRVLTLHYVSHITANSASLALSVHGCDVNAFRYSPSLTSSPFHKTRCVYAPIPPTSSLPVPAVFPLFPFLFIPSDGCPRRHRQTIAKLPFIGDLANERGSSVDYWRRCARTAVEANTRFARKRESIGACPCKHVRRYYV